MAEQLETEYKYYNNDRYLLYSKNNEWISLTVPEFVVHKVVNGVVTVKMISELLAPFCNNIEYKIEYNPNDIPNRDGNTSQFVVGKLNPESQTVPFVHFNIRFPVFMSNYTATINIYPKIINNNAPTLQYYPLNKYLKSTKLIIDIESTIMMPDFKEEDTVLFRYLNYNRIGIIKQKLRGDFFKISHALMHDTQTIIHRDRMFFPSLHLNINLINYDNIVSNILFQNNALETNEKISETFNALKTVYYNDYIMNNDTINEVDRKPISYYITLNVLQYIYNDTVIDLEKTNYKIECLGNKMHYNIKLDNGVRNYWYKHCINIADQGIFNIFMIRPQNSWYYCDLCSVIQSNYTQMFHCDHKDRSHDYCLECINNLINQNNQLKSLLRCILNDFSDDCINILVSFIIGNIRQI